MPRSDRGSALLVTVLGVIALGVVVALAAVMAWAAARAAQAFRSEVRVSRCRAALAEAAAAWERAGAPVLEDPAFPWTAPCPGPQPACTERALHLPSGRRLLWWPSGDGGAYVYLWDPSGGMPCVGDTFWP